MIWLRNIYDPTRPDARYRLPVALNQSRGEVWRQHLEWLDSCVIGEPRETANYTVGELEVKNFVGVYRKDIDQFVGGSDDEILSRRWIGEDA